MFIETFFNCLFFMTFLGSHTHLIPEFRAQLMGRRFDRLNGLSGIDDHKLLGILNLDLSFRERRLDSIEHLR